MNITEWVTSPQAYLALATLISFALALISSMLHFLSSISTNCTNNNSNILI